MPYYLIDSTKASLVGLEQVVAPLLSIGLLVGAIDFPLFELHLLSM